MAMKQYCDSCGNMRERCKVIAQKPDGTFEYCCPQCFRELEMGRYVTGK